MSPVAGAVTAIILAIVAGGGLGSVLVFAGILTIGLERIALGFTTVIVGSLVWLAALVLAVWQIIHLVTLVL